MSSHSPHRSSPATLSLTLSLALSLALALALALPLAAPARAQEAAPAPPARLHVTGSAEVSRPPDRATLTLGVETRAESAEAASEENNRVMEAVTAALLDLGIPAARLQTRRLSLRPEYGRSAGGEERRIVAYQASNQVTLELEDVDAVGRVMDVAVGAGANQVQGPFLTVEDPEEAYREALALAAARALGKARALAGALGVELGPMIEVVEGGAQPPSRRIENLPAPGGELEAIMIPGRGPSAPVSPGVVDVRATVQITWQLVR